MENGDTFINCNNVDRKDIRSQFQQVNACGCSPTYTMMTMHRYDTDKLHILRNAVMMIVLLFHFDGIVPQELKPSRPST